MDSSDLDQVADSTGSEMDSSDSELDSSDNDQASDSSSATSSSKLSIVNVLFAVFAMEARFFYKFYNPHQNWSLPENIIHYISKNPSNAKAYQKMIQSCKYFFVQKPLLVVPNSHIGYFEEGWYIRYNDKIAAKPHWFSIKLWITDEIKYGAKNERVVSSAVEKYIYQCDAKFCKFFLSNILFNDFIILASKCENIELFNVDIKNDDDSLVAFEKIVEALPNVKTINSTISSKSLQIISSQTVQELLKLLHFLNLDEFFLSGVPEDFDIESCYAYIKTNKKTKFSLYFHRNVSQQYKNRLHAIVNEIIQIENHEYTVPLINFPGMEESSSKKLRALVSDQK